jgi:hypothetical protein
LFVSVPPGGCWPPISNLNGKKKKKKKKKCASLQNLGVWLWPGLPSLAMLSNIC